MDTITSALLYVYHNHFGVTREGAVLAADPFCQDMRKVHLAVLVFVTDDGVVGAVDTINALGFTLEPGPIREEWAPIRDALLLGKYATAVNLAEAAGILK